MRILACEISNKQKEHRDWPAASSVYYFEFLNRCIFSSEMAGGTTVGIHEVAPYFRCFRFAKASFEQAVVAKNAKGKRHSLVVTRYRLTIAESYNLATRIVNNDVLRVC